MTLGLVLAAAFVQKLVEKVRSQFPVLDGWAVNLVAYGLGIFIALAFSLEAFSGAGFSGSPVADRILTGFGLGAGSGFLADWSGRSGPRSRVEPTSLPFTTTE